MLRSEGVFASERGQRFLTALLDLSRHCLGDAMRHVKSDDYAEHLAAVRARDTADLLAILPDQADFRRQCIRAFDQYVHDMELIATCALTDVRPFAGHFVVALTESHYVTDGSFFASGNFVDRMACMDAARRAFFQLCQQPATPAPSTADESAPAALAPEKAVADVPASLAPDTAPDTAPDAAPATAAGAAADTVSAVRLSDVHTVDDEIHPDDSASNIDVKYITIGEGADRPSNPSSVLSQSSMRSEQQAQKLMMTARKKKPNFR